MSEPNLVKVALVQMRSGTDVAANVAAATGFIREAAAAGATYVQTPEMTSLLDRNRAEAAKKIRVEAEDTALAAFQTLAKELSIHLHVGSLPIKLEGERAANRGFLIGPDGEVMARYDKIHMFDVDLANGETYRESSAYRPGETAIAIDLPFGRLGMTICYDVRFPQLYRALAESGCGILSVPAAFTRQTGEAHWTVLLRARAIETGSFVLAAAQAGKHEDGRETWGHSMIVDPWGRIVAEADAEPGILVAEIDLAEVASARVKVPALANGRRFSLAAPDAEVVRLRAVDGGAR